MQRRASFAATLVYGFILAFNFPVQAQTCPSYTHLTTIAGIPDSLPAGWFIYSKSGASGLFKSDLKTFSEQAIPNTNTDQPTWVDISDDGNWIVYLTRSYGSSGQIYLIKSDGTGKTLVPTTVQGTSYPSMVRFYRGSPFGNEIAYQSGYGRLEATSYTVQGSVVTPGTERIVVSFPVLDSVGSRGKLWQGDMWEDGMSVNEGFGIWKDQFFFESWFNQTQYSRPGYVTIPNGGKGVATEEDFFQWSNTADTTTWGCGSTMSHEGLYCASNAGFIGSSCVPCKNATVNGYIMDHKGFYVNHFFKLGSPAVDITTIPDANGVSINWCPADYQYGLYNEFDFDHESFTNNSEYIVCAQIGNGTNQKSALKGVWLVYWPTNNWTMLTPASNPLGQAGTTFTHPAAFFTNYSGVKKDQINHSGATPALKNRTLAQGTMINLANGVRGVSVYSLAGKMIWQYHRDSSAGAQQIALPQALRAAGCVAMKYSVDK
jgi:hypothetical protein